MVEPQIEPRVSESIEEGAVNAVDFLKSQHREVEALFAEMEEAGERATKRKENLFAAIAEKLTMHTKVEEAIFYPAVKKIEPDLVLEANEEHANIKTMIRKLQRIDANDETFRAKVTVLKEQVEHHVKEEEECLLPKCQSVLGATLLEELGAKMQAKFEQLQRLN